MAKKWTKKKPKRKKAGIPNNHRKLPVGNVREQTTDQPVRGEYQSMPLFGWVSVRQQTEDPLVMLTVLLIRSVEDPMPRASLQIELPVFDDTIHATLACLERYGWDGRVWPIDDGWPEGSTSGEEEQVLGLMEQAGLRATMTFPPGELGVALQPVKVERAQGPFLMPPLPEAEKGWPNTPEGAAKFAKLKLICENPRQFYNPMKPAKAEGNGQQKQSLIYTNAKPVRVK